MQRSLVQFQFTRLIYKRMVPDKKQILALVKPHKKLKAVLMSGLIGDTIAVESMMPLNFKHQIRVVFHIGNKPRMVEPIIRAMFPNLKHYVYFADTIHDKNVKVKFQQMVTRVVKSNHPKLSDWTIPVVYARHNKRMCKSLLVSQTLAAIDHFRLPSQYACVCPASTGRYFDKVDWLHTQMWLTKRKLPGVVVGCLYPNSRKLDFDLVGKTTLLEALEIVKGASMYLGVDGGLAPLAAKVRCSKDLQIRSRSRKLLAFNKYNYYSPHRKFPFLSKNIQRPVLDIKLM